MQLLNLNILLIILCLISTSHLCSLKLRTDINLSLFPPFPTGNHKDTNELIYKTHKLTDLENG